jgi:hypothetical protein
MEVLSWKSSKSFTAVTGKFECRYPEHRHDEDKGVVEGVQYLPS